MAFEELKQRHAAMWGSAPFERIAPTLADMHNAIVASVAAGPGEAWLDVGCGTGELAFLASETGASVQGCDLSPTLVETARRQATERDLNIPFDVGDCEALPFDDASFDVVTSSVGAIFAPDHAQAAAELARVCRPGARLALTAWKADGEIGAFFKTIASFSPPPVEGAGSPLSWGDPGHSEELLGDSFELEFAHLDAPWAAESGAEAWTEMRESFGPIKTLLAILDDERQRKFTDTMLAFFVGFETEDGMRVDRPYLLVSGTRRA